MKETWRWFGKSDAISIDEIVQTGAQGIVTALHEVPTGAVWQKKIIQARQNDIALREDGSATGLSWDVVESLPVSEDIKRQSGEWRAHIQAYKQSIENIAACGIQTICYNFMPLLDWTRTALAHPLRNGGNCMRFDYVDFAAFDLHILSRKDAAADFSDEVRDAAHARFVQMSDDEKHALTRNITAGLPGAEESYSLEDFGEELAIYKTIDEQKLRAHMVAFLEEVAPVAQRHGVRLCCHPDDPPFPLLGLPRIMSTEADYKAMCDAVDVAANGITLCSGSMGVRADNDLPAMVDRLGERIHFVHLRNVKTEDAAHQRSFYEAEHLQGNTNMSLLIAALLREEKRRKDAGREDLNIPFRPDHGQAILADMERTVQPGYPLIGRMKGLSELRGIIAAVQTLS